MHKISIIHPSRQRAQLCAKTAQTWLSSAKNPQDIEYVVSIDTDDNASHYEQHLGALKYDIGITINPNTTAIQAINTAAKAISGNLIIVVSDDFNQVPYAWDEFLLKALAGKEDYIVKTDDGSQPWIITLPIMDRAYYNRFGYIYPTHISHMFADTWMTHVADLLGKKIALPIRFIHNHYTTGKNIKDAVSQKCDMTWIDGENKYLQGVRNNFGLLPEQIKGKLQADDNHLHFLKSKGVLI